MGLILILVPLLLAGVAALWPWERQRPVFLPLVNAGTLTLSIVLAYDPSGAAWGDWLQLDAVGTVILLALQGLAFALSFYVVGYLRYRKERSNRVFTVSWLIFLGLASLVVLARHLGLMWVAIEGTTLATAPLIYFNRTRESLEATWKYLLVLSVGIALALLGTFFLAYAAFQAGLPPTLDYPTLVAEAHRLSPSWLNAAFLLLLVGYGTKMGLAPMHTWKPDAYGEAPGAAGALLAGGVTSLAFLAILRAYGIVAAAGLANHFSALLTGVGLFSMAVAALFLLGQKDLKRMLAYSSVEHMGILLLGLGTGGAALYGMMYHVFTNAATKGVLFLTAGNLHRSYDSKKIDVVQGALRRLPLSGAVFLLGFFAITGSPPFGPFFSEFSILTAVVQQGNLLLAVSFLALLFFVFLGMGKTVLHALQGPIPPGTPQTPYREGVLTAGVPLLLLVVVLALGLFLPPGIQQWLQNAASALGGHS